MPIQILYFMPSLRFFYLFNILYKYTDEQLVGLEDGLVGLDDFDFGILGEFFVFQINSISGRQQFQNAHKEEQEAPKGEAVEAVS